MILLQTKPTILCIFEYLGNKNGQNRDFLGLKSLKFPKHIPSILVPQIEHPVALWEGRVFCVSIKDKWDDQNGQTQGPFR